MAGPSRPRATDPPQEAGNKRKFVDDPLEVRLEGIEKGLGERKEILFQNIENHLFKSQKGKEVEGETTNRPIRRKPTRAKPVISRDPVFGFPLPDPYDLPQPGGPLALPYIPKPSTRPRSKTNGTTPADGAPPPNPPPAPAPTPAPVPPTPTPAPNPAPTTGNHGIPPAPTPAHATARNQEVEEEPHSPFHFPELSNEDFMMIDAAEQAARAPPTKRRRTNSDQNGNNPAPFLQMPPPPLPKPRHDEPNVQDEEAREKERTRKMDEGTRKSISAYVKCFITLISQENITGDPRLSITSPPIGDVFPSVEFSGPLQLRENIPKGGIVDWEGIDENKCFLQVYGMSSHIAAARHDVVIDQLPTLINDIFGTEGIYLVRPDISGIINREPNSFLLVGMPDDVLEILINYRVFSTPQFQWFCYPFEPFFPDFLCALENFNPSYIRTIDNPEERLLKVIKRTLMSHPTADQLRDIVKTENYYLNEDAEAEGTTHTPLTVEDVLESLSVKIIGECAPGGAYKPYINVYSIPPFTRPVLWTAWKDIFARTIFRGGVAGTGVHQKTRTCSGCHSVDHSIGLCPFPKLPGWHTTKTAASNNANNDNNNQRGDNNNRGGKPRGRGRGRGGFYQRN